MDASTLASYSYAYSSVKEASTGPGGAIGNHPHIALNDCQLSKWTFCLILLVASV